MAETQIFNTDLHAGLFDEFTVLFKTRSDGRGEVITTPGMTTPVVIEPGGGAVILRLRMPSVHGPQTLRLTVTREGGR